MWQWKENSISESSPQQWRLQEKTVPPPQQPVRSLDRLLLKKHGGKQLGLLLQQHSIPQWELVLPAPLCKHTNYPTRGTVTTRSYSRILPGQHRQVLTQLQPQNRNGNPGTLTRLGSRDSLFLKIKKSQTTFKKKKKLSSNPCKILSCVWESHENHHGKLSKRNSHSTLETVNLPDLPEIPASRQALPKRCGAFQAERQQSKSRFHLCISCHWSWCVDTLGNIFAEFCKDKELCTIF